VKTGGREEGKEEQVRDEGKMGRTELDAKGKDSITSYLMIFSLKLLLGSSKYKSPHILLNAWWRGRSSTLSHPFSCFHSFGLVGM